MASWSGKLPFLQLGQQGMTLSEILQNYARLYIHDTNLELEASSFASEEFAGLSSCRGNKVYMAYCDNPKTHDAVETQEASLVLEIVCARREVHRTEKLLAECLVREHEKIANLHRFKANQRQDSIDNSDLNVGWIKAVFNNHDRSQLSVPLRISDTPSPPRKGLDANGIVLYPSSEWEEVLYYLYVLWLDLNGFAGAIGGLWASWNIVW
ncbi:hypothetical protein EDD15DRAFT_2193489 [Pisolithus albus]|nr:hypothetical protein EDD15DRAFT_2193489 [Pisolithus albus]